MVWNDPRIFPIDGIIMFQPLLYSTNVNAFYIGCFKQRMWIVLSINKLPLFCVFNIVIYLVRKLICEFHVYKMHQEYFISP